MLSSAQTEPARYTLSEEIASSLTHGIGIILAIVGLVLLIVFATLRGEPPHIASATIFGASLVLMYTASTLYHGIQSPVAKPIFRVIDHCSIFVLIAGSYTPFTLISLHGSLGWTMFAIIWVVAFLGIIYKVYLSHKWKRGSLVFYLAMSWALLLAIKPLIASVQTGGLVLLFLGGLFYTGGTVFYLWRRLPYHHAIWHMFVLAGSICHYFSVLLYVMPS